MTPTVSVADLMNGCDAFARHEHRDAMYKVADSLIRDRWGDPEAMSDGLGVLLLTWNQAAYRYGAFDFDRLETFIRSEMPTLEGFRDRRLETGFGPEDADEVRRLFGLALEALLTSAGKRSPVGVAKAMHLLSPGIFPVWDGEIAKAYGCHWSSSAQAPAKYVQFTEAMAGVLGNLANERPLQELKTDLDSRARFPKTILKFVDEYNYARYTKHWI